MYEDSFGEIYKKRFMFRRMLHRVREKKFMVGGVVV